MRAPLYRRSWIFRPLDEVAREEYWDQEEAAYEAKQALLEELFNQHPPGAYIRRAKAGGRFFLIGRTADGSFIHGAPYSEAELAEEMVADMNYIMDWAHD